MPPKIAPSLLSADFANIAAQIDVVAQAGAGYLHLDSMDGRFVPNLTWGPKIVRDIRKLTDVPFDAHLMIEEPEKYVDDFRKAGCESITFHYEATVHQQRLLVHLREIGARAGIAVNPGTPVAMLEDLIENCDLILIMSVNPGFGGQKFIVDAGATVLVAGSSIFDAADPAAALRELSMRAQTAHHARAGN